VPTYAGPPATRSGDVAGTLRLLAYLGLAVALMVLDQRGGWLAQARRHADLMVQPLWTVAGLPGRVVERIGDDAGTRGQLAAENKRLRNALLVSNARLARLQAASADNARLRGLLGAVQRGGLDVQLAPILDVDLDPTRQRLVLDAGARDGVRQGQVVIDAGGVVGQVIDVKPMHAIALLLTDPDHAIPVAVLRNGVRLVALGRGRSDRLELASVPLSSDVKVGDVLVTSGLGERFPAGFPVGTVVALKPDDSRAFLVGVVKPAAQLDRGRDVLLLRHVPLRAVIGPVDATATTTGTGAPTTGATAGTTAPATTTGAPPPAASTTVPAPPPTTQPLPASPTTRTGPPQASPAPAPPPPTEPRR
jgi:rod shape-determining protein MreC